MLIGGFQPLSLLDYPGIIAAIVFTQGCPFRCGYCHNPTLIPTKPVDASSLIPADDIFETLKKRRHIIEGVCITGGEPTVHADLPNFIRSLKQLGFLVKLDTNGVHPRMVERLIEKRLVDFIAMDVKHTWERYPDVIGLHQTHVVDNCRETFHLIQNASIPHEFRTTIYPGFHTEKDLHAIATYFREGERYALQETRYDKMLDRTLPPLPLLDLHAIKNRLQATYPNLRLEVRA